ncbi:MAG: gliding motility-associated C-terminal domain-containing protein, partial [Bacteroidales bacterium]
YVEITDPFGCYTNDTFELSEPEDIIIAVELPLAHDSINNLSCYGDMNGYIRLSVSGGDTLSASYSYNWAHGPTSSELTNIGGGTYYVTVSDGINCTDTSEIILAEPPELVVNSVNYSDYLGYGVTCYGSSDGFIEVYPEGGVRNYHYVWERDGNDLGRDTSRIYDLGSGIYALTITDYNSCTVNWTDTLKSPPELELTITTQNIDCSREVFGVARTIVAGGAGQISYLWSNNATTDSIWNLEVGTYGITVTDGNGCSVNDTANIGQDPMLDIDIDVLNEISCFGKSDGRLRVSVDLGFPPYNFIWSDEGGTTSNTLDNVSEGSYKVTVTDDKDCRGTDSIVVIAPLKVSADYDIEQISCYSYNDGGVTIHGIYGTGPYTYWWDGELVQGNYVTGLTANVEYILEVFDSRNCYSDSIVVELSQPYILEVEIDTDNVTKPFCPDHNEGILALRVTGGTSPFTYNWDGYESQNDAFLEGINQGYYAVEVIDANNCIFDTTLYLEAEYETCLDIPNVFTPNEVPDNRNDYWDIRYRGEEGISLQEIYPNAEIKVYNRYGRIVFSCKGSECPDRWDGTYNGRKLPVDSYYYIIKLNDGTGRVYKGTVTILY